MQGTARCRRRWKGDPAPLALLLGLATVNPQAVVVGRVTAVYWSGHERLALALAEEADRARRFPGGILDTSQQPIELVLAPSHELFDSVTQGRAPDWGGGVALPGLRRVVLRVGRGGLHSEDLERVLRHELAHLALRERLRVRLPRWFEEGYAGTAAGEWQHAHVLQLNVNVARGRLWPLREVERGLRGRRAEATQAYAFAASAVQLLIRWGGPRGIDQLVAELAAGDEFDAALRAAYGITPEQFEVLWQRDLRKRYGWLGLAAAAGLLWTGLGVMAAGLFVWRRRRDRERRARLDEPPQVAEMLDDQPLQV